VQSSSAAVGANTPTAAINITGVKSDLVGIASASAGTVASEGKYASLDEPDLDETTLRLPGSGLRTHTRFRPVRRFFVSSLPAPETNTSGTPAQLSVDENMEFHSSE